MIEVSQGTHLPIIAHTLEESLGPRRPVFARFLVGDGAHLTGDRHSGTLLNKIPNK